jgi:hypothetical protein
MHRSRRVAETIAQTRLDTVSAYIGWVGML